MHKDNQLTILPKAHFSDRKLTDVVIKPGTVEIGDWAYAKCANLRSVWIPSGCRISARAFEDCPALEEVVVCGKLGADELSHLLGLAIRNWPDMTDLLVRTVFADFSGRCDADTNGFESHVGESGRDSDGLGYHESDSEVISIIDSRLRLYLAESDDAGFMPFLAGGEEDYDDAEEARRRYVHDRIVNKVLLVYERLRVAGDGATPQEYMDYLRRHNPEITFAVLMQHDPHVSEYRAMYFELGLNVGDNTFTQTLLDMSSHDAELRAMVLTRASQSCDVFDSTL